MSFLVSNDNCWNYFYFLFQNFCGATLPIECFVRYNLSAQVLKYALMKLTNKPKNVISLSFKNDF